MSETTQVKTTSKTDATSVKVTENKEATKSVRQSMSGSTKAQTVSGALQSDSLKDNQQPR